MTTFKIGDRVQWADCEYTIWSKHPKPGWWWLTRDGKTVPARAKNLTLVERGATPKSATVTPLRAPAAKKAPKVTALDRQRIDRAIRADAAAHDGVIVPNRVRQALSDGSGLTVPSQALSARYSQLAAAEDIESLGWIGTNDDARSGNAGKPQRHWRWTGRPLAGAS